MENERLVGIVFGNQAKAGAAEVGERRVTERASNSTSQDFFLQGFIDDCRVEVG